MGVPQWDHSRFNRFRRMRSVPKKNTAPMRMVTRMMSHRPPWITYQALSPMDLTRKGTMWSSIQGASRTSTAVKIVLRAAWMAM